MSIEALNWSLNQNIKNSSAKFVLVILSNYADENGFCYPSRENIAQKTSLSVRSVQDHLNWLVAHGYIAKQNRKIETRQTSNLYRIKMDQKPSADFAPGVEKPSADFAKAECRLPQKPSADFAPNTKERDTKGDTKGTRAPKTDVSEEARVESIGEVEHITRAEKKEEKEKNAIAVRPTFAAEPKSVQIAREFYPTFEPRNEYQRKLLAAVADLDIWRATVKWWAGRGYKGTNIEGLCERYQANALSAKQAEPKTAGGPYVTADVLAQMEQEFLATLN